MAYKQIKASATPNLRMLAGGRARKAPTCCDLGAEHIMRYEIASHAERPHVLKFSGGRSSGMLLLTLLHNGLLDRERGDVIVFNNTSAEHPATYAFVAECKRIAERRYGIPFFWLEFQTYEDVGKAGWARYPTYRLVKPVQHSKREPNGYDSTGAVFEEALSWKGYVPNVFSRICTETMKLFVSSEFVRDWLGNRNELIEQGHFSGRSLVDQRLSCRNHYQSGGRTPSNILAEKKSFLSTRPTGRCSQRFADYTDAGLSDRRGSIKDVVTSGGRAVLSGDGAVEYISLVGFRADEQHRLAKMRSRNQASREQVKTNGYARSDGEYLYAPLEYMGVGKAAVARFWKNQSVQLRLPQHINFSNCVYCFLKGRSELERIVLEQHNTDRSLPKELRSIKATPSRIEWWIDIEKKYSRDLRAEGRLKKDCHDTKSSPRIGFFGMTKHVSAYEKINMSRNANKVSVAKDIYEHTASDCVCTD